MARILLADDDAGMLDVSRRALELDGHEVSIAEDGTDALAKLSAAASCDVLVADVQMPGLDGISLVRQAMTDKRGLKVVLMSAHAEALERARSVAGVHVIAKPFQIEQLRAIVRTALAS